MTSTAEAPSVRQTGPDTPLGGGYVNPFDQPPYQTDLNTLRRDVAAAHYNGAPQDLIYQAVADELYLLEHGDDRL